MQILTPTKFQSDKQYLKKIKDGSIFINPTDTIYGLSCNALDKKAVQKLRDLKQRYDNPFSIWAPSKQWIKENCIVEKNAQEWLQKLPGPYTLILKLKNRNIPEIVNCGLPNIGVRIPDHWFSKVVEKLGFPVVTTSANIASQPFMTNLENLDPKIAKGVEFLIWEGEKSNRPSTIVDLTKDTIKER